MSERRWTVLELLQWTTRHFQDKGIETARLDAEVLLANALDCSRLDLYLAYEKPVLPDERVRYRELVRKRGQDRIPVSQLLGAKEFWSLRVGVTTDVLTPRPDTETLVSWALDQMPDSDREYRVLDLGTGSGAIALAIAHERPKARVTATDISSEALKVARQTADELQLSERIGFAEGDLFDAVGGREFDVVVSNPPYLASAERETLDPELSHEPEQALFGGEDGYSVLRPLVAGALDVLVPGGAFGVELASRQVSTVTGWMSAAGFGDVAPRADLAGRPRIVVGRKPR